VTTERNIRMNRKERSGERPVHTPGKKRIRIDERLIDLFDLSLVERETMNFCVEKKIFSSFTVTTTGQLNKCIATKTALYLML
jgi:hypothetical protein